MKFLCAVFVCVMLAAGCSTEERIAPPPGADGPAVTLTVANLPVLPGGHCYELWATFYLFPGPPGAPAPSHDEGYLSLGRFVVDSSGAMRAPDGTAALFPIPEGKSAQLFDDMIVTVEQTGAASDTGERDPGPVLLGGKVVGDERDGRADLSPAYDDAFGSDFSSCTGVCAIIAPTSTDPADSSSGVWFVTDRAAPAAGLVNLPVLPEGWMYEGWVVRRDAPGAYTSTGRFVRPDSADSDGPGAGAGSLPGWNFPGQDFLTGPLARPDLASPSYWFMVTLEPEPDPSPFPSGLRVLSSENASGGGHIRPLLNAAVSLPAGHVFIQR
jgi:hypothetical protein